MTDAPRSLLSDAVKTVIAWHFTWGRDATLDYAFSSLPGLARTRKALAKAFRRKLKAPKDGRPGKSGRPGAALCPECERIVAGAAVDLDGDIAQAWRRLLLEKQLCAKCSGLWHYDVRTNKSYVPLAVRNQVGPAVASALPFRHGPKYARLNAPYVLRKRDIGPGDVFEADDLTQNHMFWTWDTASLIERKFKEIVIKAGVDLREVTRPNGHKFCKRSFHSLRHGFVSGLANQGVAPEQRRAMTGHKTDGAHARYTHLESETLRTAVNKLPAIPE